MIRRRLSFRGHVYLLLLCHYLACWLVLGFSSDACFILPSGIACLCAMYRAALSPLFVLVLLLFLLPYKTHLRRVKEPIRFLVFWADKFGWCWFMVRKKYY